MRPPSNSDFTVARDHLVRTVTLPGDRRYTHRCSKAVYEATARAIEDHGKDGVTGRSIADELDLSFTQVYTALSFLVERGCVVVEGRRNFPASDVLFEDAMVEYHALAS